MKRILQMRGKQVKNCRLGLIVSVNWQFCKTQPCHAPSTSISDIKSSKINVLRSMIPKEPLLSKCGY